ncbi:MAG TPA: two-component regulator propeller domain-containing protein [Saprospiraceae bacterium]|nr:two-component regulator propeller domain-containing protein [Saprospiraceae bacterium]
MNISFKYYLFAICFLFVDLQANAQQIVHLDSKSGLISGTINTFEEDSLGYIWVGTNHGINKYSGIEFKNYNLEKFSQNIKEGIVEIINLEGDLYMIGSNGSLYKYYYEFDRFEKILSVQNIKFLSIAALNKSHLLIGLASGFIVFDTELNIQSSIQYPTTLNNREIFFYKGKVYSASSKGLYIYNYSEKNKQLVFERKYLENNDIIDFAIDPFDRIWLGTEVGGLYVIDKSKIENIPINAISNRTYAIRKIKFDKKGNALVAIDRLGLFILNDNFEIIKAFSHDPDNDNSISQNSIYEIYVDNTNALI